MGRGKIAPTKLKQTKWYEPLTRLTSINLLTISSPVAICTRTEMEDFLREAACMKEFDHSNVMRLLGESGLAGFSVTAEGVYICVQPTSMKADKIVFSAQK